MSDEDDTIRENKFQPSLINDLREQFPGAILLKNDPNYLLGFPDLTMLYEDTWAVLETKRSANARRRNNQEYYIELLSRMSYASFVYPSNKEQVLNELQQTFRTRGTARLLGRV